MSAEGHGNLPLQRQHPHSVAERLESELCEGESLNRPEEHGYCWMKSVLPALYSLADRHRETGDLTSALHQVRRLLADQPCDDHANQLVLNLLAEMMLTSPVCPTCPSGSLTFLPHPCGRRSFFRVP